MQASRTITRRSASNLALAFCLLPKTTRDDMAVLYAFCRQVDDVADETALPVAERRAQLAAWRQDLHRACAGGTPQMPVNRELQPVIAWYQLPFDLFNELLLGVEMDLDHSRYENWEALDLYCYRVASVVGLLSIEIFGYSNRRCRNYAIALGRALQLTNILRDVATDAARGRIYLPAVELRETGVTEQEILRGDFTPRYTELAARVARRARRYYRLAARALPPEDRRSMIAAELMGAVYWRLLDRLERRRFNVFTGHPVRLPAWQKAWLVARTWWRVASGQQTANYGQP